MELKDASLKGERQSGLQNKRRYIAVASHIETRGDDAQTMGSTICMRMMRWIPTGLWTSKRRKIDGCIRTDRTSSDIDRSSQGKLVSNVSRRTWIRRTLGVARAIAETKNIRRRHRQQLRRVLQCKATEAVISQKGDLWDRARVALPRGEGVRGWGPWGPSCVRPLGGVFRFNFVIILFKRKWKNFVSIPLSSYLKNGSSSFHFRYHPI